MAEVEADDALAALTATATRDPRTRALYEWPTNWTASAPAQSAAAPRSQLSPEVIHQQQLLAFTVPLRVEHEAAILRGIQPEIKRLIGLRDCLA
jgi:hypothetical protein